jgi:hypothetical protein
VRFDWASNGQSLISTSTSQIQLLCPTLCSKEFVCIGAGHSAPVTFLFANPFYSVMSPSSSTVEQLTVIVRGKWGSGRWILRMHNAFIAERFVESHTSAAWPGSDLDMANTERECTRGCDEVYFSSPTYAAEIGGFPHFEKMQPNIPITLMFQSDEPAAEACIYLMDLVLYATRTKDIIEQPMQQSSPEEQHSSEREHESSNHVGEPPVAACSLSALSMYVVEHDGQEGFDAWPRAARICLEHDDSMQTHAILTTIDCIATMLGTH